VPGPVDRGEERRHEYVVARRAPSSSTGVGAALVGVEADFQAVLDLDVPAHPHVERFGEGRLPGTRRNAFGKSGSNSPPRPLDRKYDARPASGSSSSTPSASKPLRRRPASWALRVPGARAGRQAFTPS
jgi:hypothetical protein